MSNATECPKIVLDNTLSITDIPNYDNRSVENAPNLRKKFHNSSQQIYSPIYPHNLKNRLRHTGLLGLLSFAYSHHLDVKINPHDIWNLFTSQIAKMIEGDKDQFKSLFTDSDEKKLLSVETSSEYQMPMSSLVNVVRGSVNFDSDMFFPNFSTSTDITREMNYAMFCDIASQYYDYGMFLCGIRSITIGGIVSDWETIYNSISKIYEILVVSNTELTNKVFEQQAITFFKNFLSAIEEFIFTFQKDLNDIYWKNIFTQENRGSGSDLYINGWITTLFFDPPGGKLQNYIQDIAVVFYKNLTSGNHYAVQYGGYEYKVTDNVYELVYSKLYYQLIDNPIRKSKP